MFTLHERLERGKTGVGLVGQHYVSLSCFCLVYAEYDTVWIL